MNAPSNLPFEPNKSPTPVTPSSPAASSPLPPPPPTPTPAPAPTPAPRAPGVAEPEDIFSGMEKSSSGGATRPQSVGAPVVMQTTSYAKVFAFIGIIFLVVVGAGFAFYWFLIRSPEPAAEKPAVETPAPTEAPASTSTPSPSQAEQATTTPEAIVIPTSTQPAAESGTSSEVFPFEASTPVTTPPDGVRIPPPTSVTNELPPFLPSQSATTATATTTAPAIDLDTDKDGLSDRREAELGLDASKPDSDGDGLLDGEEVVKFGTNPLNRDTDRDTYEDGIEIKNGFNPRGEGKCTNADCSL